jgi:hypothetical protein
MTTKASFTILILTAWVTLMLLRTESSSLSIQNTPCYARTSGTFDCEFVDQNGGVICRQDEIPADNFNFGTAGPYEPRLVDLFCGQPRLFYSGRPQHGLRLRPRS